MGKVKKSLPTKKKLRTDWESGKAEADAERWADEADDFAPGGRVPRWMGGGLSKGKRTLADLLKFNQHSLFCLKIFYVFYTVIIDFFKLKKKR